MYELGRSLLHHPTLGLPARGDHLIRLTKKITSNHLNISKFSKVEISLLLQTFDCQLHLQNLSKVGDYYSMMTMMSMMMMMMMQ